MIIIKTIEDIINSMVDYIKDYNKKYNKNIDTRNTTVLKDIVIDSPAQEMAKIYEDLLYLNKIPSMAYVNELSDEDIDDFAANFGLTRKSATYATGTVDFISSATEPPPGTGEPPLTANIVIPQGTLVRVPSTLTTPEIQFQTIETAIIDKDNLVKYTDVDGTIRYKASARIRSVIASSIANVGVGTITELVQPVPGILKVINTDPTIGGSDIESKESLANRIKLTLAGNNIGTESGIKKLLFTDNRVMDISISKFDDIEMKRNQFGGSVDIYVLGFGEFGGDISETENSFIYDGKSEYILINNPVIEIKTVTGLVKGAPYTFIQKDYKDPEKDYDYEFVKDIGLLADSSKEISKIRFKNGKRPDLNTIFKVVFTYDKLIEDLQVLINKDENHILAADLLIRKPQRIDVDIQMKVVIFSGYEASTVANLIKTKLDEFFNIKKLEDDVHLSDIINIIEDIPGVDYLTLISPTNDIEIYKNQFVRLGKLLIEIRDTIYEY